MCRVYCVCGRLPKQSVECTVFLHMVGSVFDHSQPYLGLVQLMCRVSCVFKALSNIFPFRHLRFKRRNYSSICIYIYIYDTLLLQQIPFVCENLNYLSLLQYANCVMSTNLGWILSYIWSYIYPSLPNPMSLQTQRTSLGLTAKETNIPYGVFREWDLPGFGIRA